jgi:hypothetical protein
MKTLLFVTLSLALCTVARSQDQQNVDLTQILGANNSFHDSVMGVSLTYPAGWEVTGGMRWGTDFRENTFRFRPISPLRASPSLYYQGFRPDSPRPSDISAWLLEAAKKKEASRQLNAPDYRNDPKMMVVRDIAGKPGLAYLALFTLGNQQMAEYNVRVVGQKAYVMFFTMGPVGDVLAVRDDIDRMAETVQVP